MAWLPRLLLLTGLATTADAVAAPDDPPRVAPWSAIRWNGDVPEVEVGDAWFEFVALDAIQSDELLAYCRKTWPDKWRKRFEEDLGEALLGMGRKVRERVDLDLVDLKTRKPVRRTNVAMSEENRKKIVRAKIAKEPAPARTSPAASIPLAPDAMAADLDQLEKALEARYSYFARSRDELEEALAAAREECAEPRPLAEFALIVERAMTHCGDGHSGVDSIEPFLTPGFLPFLVADSGGKAVAFAADRSALVDAAHPFLVAIDGLPLERWLDAAARLVPRGSPGFVRWRSLRQLRFVAALRKDLELAARPELAVTLAGEKGATVERKLALASRKPTYGDWPRTTSRKLDAATGYLRIASMEDDDPFIADLHARMAEFSGCKGLVIDVRGNSGGMRRALVELFPYFMKEGEAAYVANLARCRLPPGEVGGRREGYLEDRFLFPLTSSRFSGDEKKALESFARSFKPQWSPPAEGFSDWHFLALRSELPKGVKGAKDAKRWAGQVVILQDGGCFSASDVFLGAFKGRRNATLLGTASGGGSGRALGLTLGKSGLEVRLSSMASFRPDGALYDGNGIEPDVVVPPAPTDWIGASDAQLDAAIKRLRDPKR